MRTLLNGIAPEHGVALVAGLVALLGALFVRGGSRSFVDRWAFALLAYASAVHIFLPVGHASNAVAFLLDGIAVGVLAWRAYLGKGWRIGTAILAPLTVAGYLVYGEEPDQVGILTMFLELTAFGLAVATTRRVGRVFGSIATVFVVLVAGAVVWVASFKAHQATSADSQSPSVGHSHGGDHEHLARAQAGVIMRPLPTHHATAEETAAAIELAAAITRETARYKQLSTALASGYQLPGFQKTGMNVHLEHKEYKKDGVLLDPAKPEMLVYAIDGGTATLLGVVFVMERAGDAGIAPGGPITRWHAHNLCISLVPPGIGIVTPYGGCPSLSVTLTVPEMMHVWIVDPPGGPFAEGIPDEWTLSYHREHGLPA